MNKDLSRVIQHFEPAVFGQLWAQISLISHGGL